MKMNSDNIFLLSLGAATFAAVVFIFYKKDPIDAVEKISTSIKGAVTMKGGSATKRHKKHGRKSHKKR